MQNKFIWGWDFYFSFRKKLNNHFHKFLVKIQFYNHQISTSISIYQSSYFIIFKPIRKLIPNQTEILLSIYTFIFNKIKLSPKKKRVGKWIYFYHTDKPKIERLAAKVLDSNLRLQITFDFSLSQTYQTDKKLSWFLNLQNVTKLFR